MLSRRNLRNDPSLYSQLPVVAGSPRLAGRRQMVDPLWATQRAWDPNGEVNKPTCPFPGNGADVPQAPYGITRLGGASDSALCRAVPGLVLTDVSAAPRHPADFFHRSSEGGGSWPEQRRLRSLASEPVFLVPTEALSPEGEAATVLSPGDTSRRCQPGPGSHTSLGVSYFLGACT